MSSPKQRQTRLPSLTALKNSAYKAPPESKEETVTLGTQIQRLEEELAYNSQFSNNTYRANRAKQLEKELQRLYADHPDFEEHRLPFIGSSSSKSTAQQKRNHNSNRTFKKSSDLSPTEIPY